MNRRSFMASILASATAPYVSSLAGVLMPVKTIVDPFAKAEERLLELMFPPDDRLWGQSIITLFGVPQKQLAINLFYRDFIDGLPTAPSPAAPAPQSR